MPALVITQLVMMMMMAEMVIRRDFGMRKLGTESLLLMRVIDGRSLELVGDRDQDD